MTRRAMEQAQKEWPATLAGEAAKSKEVVYGEVEGLASQSRRGGFNCGDHCAALTTALEINLSACGYSKKS